MADRFKRGQVWLNPDDMLMMVVSVRTKDNEQKVNYVTEQGEFGYFYSSNKSITDNIRPLATEAEQLRKERNELARAYRYADAVATIIGHIVDTSPQTKIWRELAKKVNENANNS